MFCKKPRHCRLFIMQFHQAVENLINKRKSHDSSLIMDHHRLQMHLLSHHDVDNIRTDSFSDGTALGKFRRNPKKIPQLLVKTLVNRLLYPHIKSLRRYKDAISYMIISYFDTERDSASQLDTPSSIEREQWVIVRSTDTMNFFLPKLIGLSNNRRMEFTF